MRSFKDNRLTARGEANARRLRPDPVIALEERIRQQEERIDRLVLELARAVGLRSEEMWGS